MYFFGLTSKKLLSVFAENRLKEMRAQSDVHYRYIASSENPADISARSKTVEELENSSLWWRVPTWFTLPEQSWPTWDIPEITEETLRELDATSKGPKTFYEAGIIADDNIPSPFELMDENHSSLSKLIRVTAWILRFIQKLKHKKKEVGPLTASELKDAKKHWELYIQQKNYPEAYKALKTNQRNTLKEQLGLKLDEDSLIRCHGRFVNVELPEEVKYPKLLPRKQHFTDLIIESYHKGLLHAGITHTLSQLRHEYWIPHGRTEVKRVLRKCTICCRHEGGRNKIPPMAPWPKARVLKSSPFTFVVLDYLGPLYIKESGKIQKTWVCLFTCLAIRAVYLEPARNMSAEQFLLCLRRFIARRGQLTKIVCDNASQFKLDKSTLDKAWQKCLRDPDVLSYTADKGISWQFIVEMAPWMGCLYERPGGLVKRILRKVLGKLSFTYFQLLTILTESEAVLNSRPLLFVGK